MRAVHARPIVLSVSCALAVATVAAPDPRASALDTLVAAERAFANVSVEHGMREAFLANLCPDGIVFRPDPVNGRHVWENRTNPKGTLRWAPRFAEVSGDGTLGVTTGPWDYAAPGSKDEPAHGDFVTVWKRHGDRWCAAVDLGVGHDASSGDVDHVALEPGPEHRPPRPPRRHGVSIGLGFLHGGTGVGFGAGTPLDDEQQVVAHGIHTLMSAERTFAFTWRKQGAAEAYRKAAAEDVRFLRDGALPEVGITPAIAGSEPRPRDTTWQSFGSGVAGSADLGYSYGLAIARAPHAARPDTSGYLHVWREAPDGTWRLAVDVESGFPKR